MEIEPRKTAIITGASSGIGAEFAHQLARDGYELVLVARREDRLAALRSELEKAYGKKYVILPADLSQDAGVSIVEEYIERLESIEMLVNSAGFGMSGRFVNIEIERHLEMINVHVIASVRLVRAALPGMIARHKGSIVNVSSLAAVVPLTNVTYSSTKGYIQNFSRTLHSELAGTGVRIQVLLPGFVVTGFHETAEFSRFRRSMIPKFMWLSPQTVVRESLDGLERGNAICIPGRFYRIVNRLASNSITRPVIEAGARRMYKQRRKAATSEQ